MKCEEFQAENQITGDVIGDTTYSERFVLKILLKLASLDTLKNEMLDKTFEEDLCTLWDMTAERDVVLFLKKHDVLNLLCFAWPIIESARIAEIVVGIIANMCCHKEAVVKLLQLVPFLKSLIECVKGNDSVILIQLLRLINSSIFLHCESHLAVWLQLFVEIGYSKHLYFILKNSSNKDLLIQALENLNTICTYCNIEELRSDFFGHFVSVEALESLVIAYIEITEIQKDMCDKEQIERILLISMQITVTLVGFDKSVTIFKYNKNDTLKMISMAFQYYEKKLITLKEIDMDLVDIVDSTISVTNILNINEISDLKYYFIPSCNMWKTLHYMVNDQNYLESDTEDLVDVTRELKTSLSNLMFVYMETCQVDSLLKALDEVSSDLDDVASFIENKLILNSVLERVSSYRPRLK